MHAYIDEKQIILKQPGRYIGWPSVEKTSWGELIAVFSGDRDQHICPFGKTQMVRSADAGNTWSAPETINDSPLDDRDAGIIETGTGALILSWYTSTAFAWVYDNDRNYYLAKYGAHTIERWEPYLATAADDAVFMREVGSWTRRSEDRGRTWEAPVRLPVFTPHGPALLRDGRLLYLGIVRSPYARKAVLAMQSVDDGRSWQVLSAVPPPEGIPAEHLDEPHVVETADGRLLGMMRYQTGGKGQDDDSRFLYQTVSADGGKTWSVPQRTNLWGYPPHLRRLADGRVLLSYGHRHEPYGSRAIVSPDGGLTWDLDARIELPHGPSDDLGYPCSVELDGGEIYTVFYQRDRAEELPCLMAARWRVPA